MRQLETDLAQVLYLNNKTIEDRIKLQDSRKQLLACLRENLRSMVLLEKQLKSASTLSVSSASSLGSLSNSSKDSASSLFSDIYTNEYVVEAVPQRGHAHSSVGSSSSKESCSSVSNLQKRLVFRVALALAGLVQVSSCLRN